MGSPLPAPRPQQPRPDRARQSALGLLDAVDVVIARAPRDDERPRDDLLAAVSDAAGLRRLAAASVFGSTEAMVEAWWRQRLAAWALGLADHEVIVLSQFTRWFCNPFLQAERLFELHRRFRPSFEASTTLPVRTLLVDVDSIAAAWRHVGAKAGIPNPDEFASHCVLLLRGALGIAAAHGEASPFSSARIAAGKLVIERHWRPTTGGAATR